MSTIVPPVPLVTSRSVARSPQVAGPRSLSTRRLGAASVITSYLQEESVRVWMQTGKITNSAAVLRV